MGLNEALPHMAERRWECTDCESATRQDTSIAPIRDWRCINCSLVWGLLPLSGVSYGKAKPVVHDLDSGDVDGESESQGCGWFLNRGPLGGDVWCGGRVSDQTQALSGEEDGLITT